MLETMPISEKLKMLRDRRGLTLDELAEQTGLSRSALSNYETNESKEVSQFALVTLANSMPSLKAMGVMPALFTIVESALTYLMK